MNASLDSIVLAAIPIMVLAVLCVPRQFSIHPMIVAACYIPLQQKLLIGALNFPIMRVLIVVYVVRLLIRKEYREIELNMVDRVFIWWVGASLVLYVLLWKTSNAITYQLGFTYDALGFYWIARSLVRTLDEYVRIVAGVSLIVMPLAVAMLYENMTGENVFSLLGWRNVIGELRDGHFRSYGAFSSPILAGTFGATLLPLVVVLRWQKGMLVKCVIGSLASLLIVYSSNSSGPLMALFSGILALVAWPLNRNMRMIRWLIVLTAISLHIYMKAPVWYVFARLSSITGGGGWHRSEVIEQAINHFGEWWLVGIRVTSGWMPTALAIDPTRADITNHFIAQGVNGGMVRLILFVAIIVCSYKWLGGGLRTVEVQSFSQKIVVWGLGASLFAHIVSFFSVSYFDQINVFWYFLLASIASIGDDLRDRAGPCRLIA